MCAFTVNFMFNYFAPITVLNHSSIQGRLLRDQVRIHPYNDRVLPDDNAVHVHHQLGDPGQLLLEQDTRNNNPPMQQMFIGSVIMGIAPFFVGPDTRFTGVERNLYVCFLAMGIEGFAAAYLYTPP
jgi:hypothetical protein